MGVLHPFSTKNIFYDKMDLQLFYFRVTPCSATKLAAIKGITLVEESSLRGQGSG